MTEYDFSPDAYERYIATQQRIARWVDNTQRYPPVNPFVSTPTAEPHAAADYFPSSPLQSQSRNSESSSDTYHSRSHNRRPPSNATHPRPDVHRSQTAPVSSQRSSSNHHTSSHSSSRNPRSHADYTHSSSRSHSTHHTSSSQSSSSRYTGSTAATTVPYKTVSTSKNDTTIVTPSDHRPTCVMIDGGRGGYVIVPQTGTRLEILDSGSYESYVVSSPSSRRSRSSRSEKPLLKRLFSGL